MAECTSFIIDVSERMIQTDKVKQLLQYLEYTLLEKCEKSRKTDWVDCFLTNHIHTDNSMQLENIYELQKMEAPLLGSQCQEISKMLCSLKPTDGINTDEFNTIEQCLLLSTLQIKEKFHKRKMLRQIMCFTDDMKSITLEDSEIDEMLQEYTGRFVLVDCRTTNQITKDNSSGVTGPENSWFRLISKCEGSTIVKLSELIQLTNTPRPPVVKPVRVFSGQLRLGAELTNIAMDNISENISDTSCLCINVEGYPATKSISGLHRKLKTKNDEIDNKNFNNHYTIPKNVIEYEIYPENNKEKEQKSIIKKETEEGQLPEGVPISSKSVAKAYRYGTDYVVLPKMIADELYYETAPGIDIRGFMDQNQLPRRYLNSESVFIMADTRLGSIGDVTSFSALVDTLLETSRIAICRYVQKSGADVQMCALIPLNISTTNLKKVSTNNTLEENNTHVRTLIISRLPFSEDERITILKDKLNNEKVKTETKDQEELEQKIDNLMSNFVDSMSIDTPNDIPSEQYYQHFEEIPKFTNLPLPEQTIPLTQDPLQMYAITPFAQRQVLLDYFHKVIIEGQNSSEFTPPVLPENILQKIDPLHNGPSESMLNDIEQLTSILGIKKVPIKTEDNTLSNATDRKELEYNITEEAPPLDELLARGRRD
ncbi:similar to Saccharomyces cerevisiae YMR106C YKU80 Subunit of the telomeric Ku complex (Yku70p-Yku80p), involved in telomere length maintenance, structure and telomere position effect [Maudiozyma barnettii]|uniref:ATP-dependent DNA helicase II subunit 2 n=1 Tax=Maudiozyma barnettii TaxID=61262 RepID=A0A8H2VFX4_9SACH|nr:ATP-dependent DNA helicase YKU80 [Kazachstania barnettii]CAB4254444.1 similar to Saccharomyces cerevisiae YMR106C YKU80 Subunit of the telomeric Ku complex (Yku70p-Yku80p), involved in telomere length maintenance, structure and telomere position effect [Kazachstania barnettii]CAD1782399.1 similar to Saccharomyces cerevisiae YMR106C YKU80 Subunit of the telomeric Ku complex (Yku70p-Yku80p), involved in telomere length maintenance, structure and telomere position effect [Kazachstania barnettii]